MTEHDGGTPGEGTPIGGAWTTNPWIGPEPREAPRAPAPDGWGGFGSGTSWNDMKVPPPAGNGAEPASRETPAPDQISDWFVDDVPAPSAVPAAAVLPRRLPTPHLPALITFAVLCLGVLLIASSIIWHPQAP